MVYDFDQFVDRIGTNSVKWEFMTRLDPQATEETLPYWVADMDYPCAEPILEALRERVERQIFGYGNNRTAEYFRAVCGWYQHRFNWYVNSQDIVFSPGVIPAIGFLIELLTRPGEGVMMQCPVYYPFSNLIVNHGRNLVNNSLVKCNGRYTMDFNDLEQKAKDPGNKVMLLCSPHNPVGRVWEAEELCTLGRICAENDVWIVSDEIHYDLVRRGVKHVPMEKAFPEYKQKIISLTAPSKTFNLAGLQSSNVIIHDPELRQRWQSELVGKYSIKAPNCLAIVAAQTAFLEGEDWLEQVIDYLDANMVMIRDFLQEHLPYAKYSIPEGTFLGWIDLSAYGYGPEELKQKMLREAKVLVEEGTMFGAEGKGYIRINAACTRDVLSEGLERIARVLNSSGNDGCNTFNVR
jgi:cystathionine beta-lyase